MKIYSWMKKTGEMLFKNLSLKFYWVSLKLLFLLKYINWIRKAIWLIMVNIIGSESSILGLSNFSSFSTWGCSQHLVYARKETTTCLLGISNYYAQKKTSYLRHSEPYPISWETCFSCDSLLNLQINHYTSSSSS